MVAKNIPTHFDEFTANYDTKSSLAQLGYVETKYGDGKDIVGEYSFFVGDTIQGIIGDARNLYEDPPINFFEETSGKGWEMIKKFKKGGTEGTKLKNTGLEDMLQRLAFSKLPLHYDGTIIPNDGFTPNFIADNLDKFSIEVAFNTNPNGMTGCMTPPDAEMQKEMFNGGDINKISKTDERLSVLLADSEPQRLEGFGKNIINVLKTDKKTGKNIKDTKVVDYVLFDGKTATPEAVDIPIIMKNKELGYNWTKSNSYKRDRPFAKIDLESLFSAQSEIYNNNVTPREIQNNLSATGQKLSNVKMDLIIPNEQGIGQKIINKKEYEQAMKRMNYHPKVAKKFNELFSNFNKKGKCELEFRDLQMTPPLALALREFMADLHFSKGQDTYSKYVEDYHRNDENNGGKTVSRNLEQETSILQKRFDLTMHKLTNAKTKEENTIHDNYTPDLLLEKKDGEWISVNGTDFQKESDNEKLIVDFKFSYNKKSLNKTIEKYSGNGKNKALIVYLEGEDQDFKNGATIDYETFLNQYINTNFDTSKKFFFDKMKEGYAEINERKKELKEKNSNLAIGEKKYSMRDIRVGA